MNGVTTCLCVGALIWAGLAIIGSLTGRNRRAHLLGGTSADPWASAGLAWLFWSHHHHHTDDTTNAAMTVTSLSGFVGTETVTATAAGTYDSKDAGARTATAAYTLANGTNGGLASNYSVANTTANGTIIVCFKNLSSCELGFILVRAAQRTPGFASTLMHEISKG